MYKTSFIIQSYLTWESSCALSSCKCHTSTPSDALKVETKQKYIAMFLLPMQMYKALKHFVLHAAHGLIPIL